MAKRHDQSKWKRMRLLCYDSRCSRQDNLLPINISDASWSHNRHGAVEGANPRPADEIAWSRSGCWGVHWFDGRKPNVPNGKETQSKPMKKGGRGLLWDGYGFALTYPHSDEMWKLFSRLKTIKLDEDALYTSKECKDLRFWRNPIDNISNSHFPKLESFSFAYVPVSEDDNAYNFLSFSGLFRALKENMQFTFQICFLGLI